MKYVFIIFENEQSFRKFIEVSYFVSYNTNFIYNDYIDLTIKSSQYNLQIYKSQIF